MRGGVASIFAASVGLLVVSAAALGINLYSVRDRFASVEHTNELIRDVAAAQRALSEAQSGERSYLLTGDAGYRDAYTTARAEIPRLLDALGRLVADNPPQVERLKALRPLVEARLAEMERGMALGPGREADVLAFLRAAQAAHLGPQMTAQFEQLRQVEMSMLDQRQEQADHILVLATVLAVTLSVRPWSARLSAPICSNGAGPRIACTAPGKTWRKASSH